jgi:hypothetical protein
MASATNCGEHTRGACRTHGGLHVACIVTPSDEARAPSNQAVPNAAGVRVVGVFRPQQTPFEATLEGGMDFFDCFGHRGRTSKRIGMIRDTSKQCAGSMLVDTKKYAL